MEKLKFKGLNGMDSICGITKYPNNVFVLTELNDNPGTSVTNAAEIIARLISERYNIPGIDITIIEEYPKTQFFPQELDIVTFGYPESFRNPEWKRIGKAKFAELTGVSLEEHIAGRE